MSGEIHILRRRPLSSHLDRQAENPQVAQAFRGSSRFSRQLRRYLDIESLQPDGVRDCTEMGLSSLDVPGRKNSLFRSAYRMPFPLWHQEMSEGHLCHTFGQDALVPNSRLGRRKNTVVESRTMYLDGMPSRNRASLPKMSMVGGGALRNAPDAPLQCRNFRLVRRLVLNAPQVEIRPAVLA